MRILITCDVIPQFLDKLTGLGHEVDYHPFITTEGCLEIIELYEGIIQSTKVKTDVQMIDAAVNLQFIARVGSGMDHIDVGYAKEKGIACFSSPEGNCNAVAESALGMLLSLFNNLSKAQFEVRDGLWIREQNRGVELAGKTIGIIGCGHTGSSFAHKLQGLGVTVLVYDKYQKKVAPKFAKEVDLKTLQTQADIISFHIPLTEETHEWCNEDFIEEMTKPFYLINTARGAIVNYNDVLKGLESGKLLGACIDVLPVEPPDFQQDDQLHVKHLADRENVILTPHIAGWTHEAKERMTTVLFDKLSAAKLI